MALREHHHMTEENRIATETVRAFVHDHPGTSQGLAVFRYANVFGSTDREYARASGRARRAVKRLLDAGEIRRKPLGKRQWALFPVER